MSNSSVEERILKVSELNSLIKLSLESQFGEVRVLGEASGVKLASSGHLYFTLKDETAAIRVVMFRGSLLRSPLQKLEEGQRLIVRGTVSLYPPRGELQIIASELQPQGVGDIFAALERLKKFYQEKGYFDPARKRRLPLLPKRIGVVTSPTGAAIRDIVRILHRRFPGIELILYPARVQGEGAAAEIAGGIRYFNEQYGRPLDVLIVGRGGGSYEDLWAFNEAPVIEAIYGSRIPVISAVGHEIDFTIADFVADVRAATPSAAAELVVGKKEEFDNRIGFIQNRLGRLMERLFQQRRRELLELVSDSSLIRFPRRLLEAAQHLDTVEFALQRQLEQRLRLKREALGCVREKLVAIDFLQLLANRRLRIDHLERRRQTGFSQRVQERRQRAGALQARLEGLNPERILQKGYSITSRDGQEVVKDAADLQAEERIRIRFARGQVTAEVLKE